MSALNRKYRWLYLACSLDTEGSLCISRAINKNTKKVYYAVHLDFINTSKKWLKYICNLLEQEFVYTLRKPAKGWKELYIVYCKQKNLRRVLPQIQPYLIIKKKQAKLALEFLNLRFNKRGRGCPYQKRIHKIYKEMKKLHE